MLVKKLRNYGVGVILLTLLPSFALADDGGASNKSKNSNALDGLKSALEELKKNPVIRPLQTKEKLYNLSVNTGYSDNKDNDSGTQTSGKNLSIALSRKLSNKDQIYGFVFGSTSHTDTIVNEFYGRSRGLGLGYSIESVAGINFGGNVSYARSSSNSILTLDTTGTSFSVFPGFGQNSYTASVNASKSYQLPGGYTGAPMVNLSYSLGNDIKPTTILGPKLNLSKSFADNWLVSHSVGGAFSDRAITSSGKKWTAEIGLGVGYYFPNKVLLKVDLNRSQSSGSKTDSLSLSTALPF